MRRAFFLTAFTTLAFALTAWSLARLAPEPDTGDLDDKLRHFAAHGDRYDLVFFGSSRILRGVRPEILDAELARRGLDVRSFNFGIDGMSGYETDALVRRVLAMRPESLRWAVVELDGWSAEMPEANRYKARMIGWHDAEATAAAVRDTARREKPAGARLELAAAHLLHGAARATAAGRGRDLLRSLPGGSLFERRDEPEETIDGGRGFLPFSERSYGTPSTHPFRRAFLGKLPLYERAVEYLSAANRAPAPVRAADREALAAQSAELRRAGVRPIHLVTPTARPLPHLMPLARPAAAGESGSSVLTYNDPTLYPELFTVENRFDAEHLTTEGAALFSLRLADDLARMLADDALPDHRSVAAAKNACAENAASENQVEAAAGRTGGKGGA